MAAEAPPTKEMPRLRDRYQREIVPALMKQFQYSNVWQVPRVVKVCVNMGVSEGKEDVKTLEAAMRELSLVVGQKPALTRAKKSIAAFGLREGMPIGCRVTIRGDRMYEFLDRLFNVALPRIRDFRGLPVRSVDGRGNYSLGLREQLIFPEINVDDVTRAQGMDVTIVTTAPTDEEAVALLRELGLPLQES